jgi:hypothetical protein
MKLPSFCFGNDSTCTYCGDVASSMDHCIPVLSQSTFRKGKMPTYGPRTPSCQACNGILGSKYFDTFLERCQYVSDGWKSRVKPVIWTNKEINELQGQLRSFVSQDVQRRLHVFNRSDWMDTRDFWLNLESLTWVQQLKQGDVRFHKGLFDYFRSTIAMAELVYSENWKSKKNF